MLGIIGAMQVEVNALKEIMTEQESRMISGMEYVKGKIDGHEVVAVVCGEGKVASAICAQTLILEYHVDGVCIDGLSCMYDKDETQPYEYDDENYYYGERTLPEFQGMLLEKIAAPRNRVKFSCNAIISETTPIYIPHEFSLCRYI